MIRRLAYRYRLWRWRRQGYRVWRYVSPCPLGLCSTPVFGDPCPTNLCKGPPKTGTLRFIEDKPTPLEGARKRAIRDNRTLATDDIADIAARLERTLPSPPPES